MLFFIHLRRYFKNICHYKTKQHKKEIDFVVTNPKGNLILIQVCLDLSDKSTFERETSAIL